MVINAVEKKTQVRGIGIVVEGLVAVLNRVVRVGLIVKMTFEQSIRKEKEISKCREREQPV